jgi:hypothetical protein
MQDDPVLEPMIERDQRERIRGLPTSPPLPLPGSADTMRRI